MTTINNNNPVQTGPVTPWDVGGPDPANADISASLTPDALMAYCESRLSNLDSKIQGLMDKQKNVGTEQQTLQKLEKEVGDLQAGCGTDGATAKNPAACQQLEQHIEDAIKWMEQNDPTSPAIGDLKNLHDTVMATGSGPYNDKTDQSGTWHGYYGSGSGTGIPNGTTPPQNCQNSQDSIFGTDELKNFSDTLTGINNSLSSGSELDMIQIQSYVSERSTHIQLVTNTIQSLDDGKAKIVGNIGH